MKQHWKRESRKYPKPKAVEVWGSPKINDPRQMDMLDYLSRREVGAGFAQLDEAIKYVNGK